MRNQPVEPLIRELEDRLTRDPEDRLIPDTEVQRRYGGVSAMTLWRWDHDQSLGFPKPIRIRKRKYRSVRELDEFDERRRAVAV